MKKYREKLRILRRGFSLFDVLDFGCMRATYGLHDHSSITSLPSR